MEAETSPERRVSHRTTIFYADNLRVEPGELSTLRHGAGGASVGNGPGVHLGVGGELLDISNTGLGLKVLTPLVIGSDVSIEVELHSRFACVVLKISASVVHCLSEEVQLYRVGLSFNCLESLPLQCGHEHDYVSNIGG